MSSPSAVERLESVLARRPWVFFTALAALALALAWICRFIQDDAFISFVYAKALVNGDGLTWFGARVEGYTNFLWVLWIALGMRVGVEPVAWSQVGGLLSWLAVLLGTWRLSFRLFGARLPAAFALLLLMSNYTLLAYATGGLETMTQAALLVWATTLLHRITHDERPSIGSAAGFSLQLALALLLRLDSAVPGIILGILALTAVIRRRLGIRFLLALILPFLALVGPQMAWKWSYYGRLLPNSYYAKLGSDVSIGANGLVFLGRFLHWYLIWPPLAAGLLALGLRFRVLEARVGRSLLPTVLVVAAWFTYIAAIGGDFMEFRFLVPIAPLLFLLLAYSTWFALGQALLGRPLLAAAAVLFLLAGASTHHARTFKGMTADRTLDSIDALATFYDRYPDGDWTRLGKALNRDLSGTGAIISTTATGAIPFYSGLETIDQWGLNDIEIALEGNPPLRSRRPGHRRHARLSHLKARGVNLVIGHPQIIPRGRLTGSGDDGWLRRWIETVVSNNTEPIGTATVVAMPIDEKDALLMWYLTPSPRIDQVIGQRRWEGLRLVLR